MNCSITAVFFYACYTPRLTFTIPRRTFDDVENCGSLRRIATAFYPLVVSDLRIVVLVWIRERFASGGGLWTATALDCGETGIDSRIDIGLAVAAFGVPGRSRLATTSHIVQRACSLPAGEIGVTASCHTLSQVALVIASGHAGDYLPLLAARETQEGAETFVSQPPVVSEVSVAVPPAAGGAVFYRHFRLFCRILPGSFLCLSRSSSLGAFLRYCGCGCAVCWVWGPLCP